MATQLYISSGSRLNRFHVSPHVRIGTKVTQSVEVSVWYLTLLQEGKDTLAKTLLDTPRLLQNPANVPDWLANRGFNRHAKWVLDAPALYRDVLIHLAKDPDSSIHRAFQDLQGRMERENVQKIQFIAVTGNREYVWSSGLKADEEAQSQRLPGWNLYGKCVEVAFEQFCKGRFVPNWGVPRLLREQIEEKILEDHPPLTILVMSDSECKFMEGIDRGDTFSISGGTYRDMVSWMDIKGYDPTKYVNIVIQCGVNCLRLSKKEQETDWGVLMAYICEIFPTPKSRAHILVSGIVPNHKAGIQASIDHTNWVSQQLVGTGIQFLDWFINEPNPFLLDDGTDNPAVFEYSDEFHLSHHGIRAAWIVWCSYFPAMRAVSYRLKRRPGAGFCSKIRNRKRRHPDFLAPGVTTRVRRD